MGFRFILRELRVVKGLTQKDLAKYVNKGESTVRMWELGKSEPDSETMLRLCEIFNVSLDYLLGRTDSPTPATQTKQAAFMTGLDQLELDKYKKLSEDDKKFLAEQFNSLIDRLQKK